jgi:biopolymer transport protein TolR
MYHHRERKEIFIRADRDVAYSAVIDAMSAAKTAGVSKISMLTQPPRNG